MNFAILRSRSARALNVQGVRLAPAPPSGLVWLVPWPGTVRAPAGSGRNALEAHQEMRRHLIEVVAWDDRRSDRGRCPDAQSLPREAPGPGGRGPRARSRWLACTPVLARAGRARPPIPRRGRRVGCCSAIARSPRPALRTATRLATGRTRGPRPPDPGGDECREPHQEMRSHLMKVVACDDRGSSRGRCPAG